MRGWVAGCVCVGWVGGWLGGWGGWLGGWVTVCEAGSDLETLVHEGGRVDGNLLAHAPVGVLQRVLDADLLQLLRRPVAERAARRRQDDTTAQNKQTSRRRSGCAMRGPSRVLCGGSWVVDPEWWIPSGGSRVVDPGWWIPSGGSWVVDPVWWILCGGSWVVDSARLPHRSPSSGSP